ncbi:MAG TPA: polyprenyl synthetase family protein, partial [Terriglobia bacterium]
DVVKRKTAFLFSGCMRLPGIASGSDPKAANCLAAIGMNMGMAFQLVDDLLDLTATQQTLGKPVASDLKEGKLTLPVALALAGADPEALSMVRSVLSEREFRSVESRQILALVEKHDGIGQTRAIAEEYIRTATTALRMFPPSPYRDAIAAIPDFILNRGA